MNRGTLGGLANFDLRGDSGAQFGDVADDADEPSALSQRVKYFHDLLERVLIEAAEPLVDEEGVEADASRARRHDFAEAEGEGADDVLANLCTALETPSA